MIIARSERGQQHPKKEDHEWPALAGELEPRAAADDDHKSHDPRDQESEVRGDDIEKVVDPERVPVIGEIMVFNGLPHGGQQKRRGDGQQG